MLLQARNPGDPMRGQEVRCFARALDCPAENIQPVDLINHHHAASHLTRTQLDSVDVVLLGGSGDYSVAEGGVWLPAALEAMRDLVALAKPTFASCWGFQAMSQALGGHVVHDPARAELGTLPISLTPAGRADPVFGGLGDSSQRKSDSFLAAMGHEDIVDQLPAGAMLLASTPRVTHQAFVLPGKPIYGTQFHPELDCPSLIERLETYPHYVNQIAGISFDRFVHDCRPTPAANTILRRFIEHVFG